MSFSSESKFSDISIPQLVPIIDNLNEGVWVYDTNTKELKFSDGFQSLLGYKPEKKDDAKHWFFEQLIYFADKNIFQKALNTKYNEHSSPVQFRLLTKKLGYQWFESSVRKHEIANGHTMYGSIININEYKKAALLSAQTELLYNEISTIAKIGSWEIDAPGMTVTLSKQLYNIYELEKQVQLSLEEAISFFEPGYRETLQSAANDAVQSCQPFDMEAVFRTAKNNLIWVRIKGLPIIDNNGKCLLVRGLIQDIDYNKKKTIELESSLSLLNDQNRRLQNFAHIVSHNLRSHSGNLEFMVNLFDENVSPDEQAEIFGNIRSISKSFSTTIEHLNEIVKIQTEVNSERKKINFELTFNNILNALDANIIENKAVISSDFSQCPTVKYIPAYLESIFLNLLTNALKYRNPDRNPQINCKSYLENGHTYLIFSDNGLGIDLERYGHEVFSLYKTFHKNTNANGIGLFITKNQIESLGGSIRIESTVNVGTTFTIRLL